jgi:hypothetical protein
MGLFIFGAIFLVPLGLISGLLALGWGWAFISTCFFSFSNYCGMDMSFKATIFGFISFGCFTGLVKLWNKAK